MGYIDRALIADERIIHRGRTHWLIYAPGLLTLVVGASLLFAALRFELTIFRYLAFGILAISGLVLAWEWLKAVSTELAITNKRVMAKIRIIRRNTFEVSHPQVESIRADQSILGRMLGYGGVLLTGTGGSTLRVPGLAVPMKFAMEANQIVADPERKSSPRSTPSVDEAKQDRLDTTAPSRVPVPDSWKTVEIRVPDPSLRALLEQIGLGHKAYVQAGDGSTSTGLMQVGARPEWVRLEIALEDSKVVSVERRDPIQYDINLKGDVVDLVLGYNPAAMVKYRMSSPHGVSEIVERDATFGDLDSIQIKDIVVRAHRHALEEHCRHYCKHLFSDGYDWAEAKVAGAIALVSAVFFAVGALGAGWAWTVAWIAAGLSLLYLIIGLSEVRKKWSERRAWIRRGRNARHFDLHFDPLAFVPPSYKAGTIAKATRSS